MRLRPIFVSVLLVVVALVPVFGQLPPYGGAREYAADLQARRAALMETIGPGTALVLWSAPSRVYSTDTDYEYRQESNLLYLTGFDEQAATLVLVPGATGPREFLFVRARDPFVELWYGRIPPPDEVTARTGIAQVFPQRETEAFDAFVRGLLAGGSPAEVSGAEAAGRAVAPAAGAFRIMILANPSARTIDPDTVRQIAWAREAAATRPDTTVVPASGVIERQRRVKTAYEQQIMRRAADISAQAHIDGMRATRPGRWEYQVEAAIEHRFLAEGAMSWAYPSIVGSGPNATILHYVRSTRRMEAGDLLLVDAGANFQGLTADVTRTWPVNGRFTTAQRQVYDVVLEALEAGAAAARPGGSIDAVNLAVRQVVGRGLLRLGLVTDPDAASGRSPQIDLWFPHSPYHGIGVDVHESLGPLVPGVAFTIEPGIYVRPDVLDRLARDAAQADAVRTIRPAVDRYRDMGIRIEDTFLMTPTGPEALSAAVPKAPGAIERIVGRSR